MCRVLPRMSPLRSAPSITCWPPTASTASRLLLSAKLTPASIIALTLATCTASSCASVTRLS